MLTPKEATEAFVEIWNLKRPLDSEDAAKAAILLEALPSIPVYGGSAETRKRRAGSEYALKVLQRLEATLANAHVTDSLKQYLVDVCRTSLSFGSPPRMDIHLELLGIVPEEERYGIFDPRQDVAGIEGKWFRAYHRHVESGPMSSTYEEDNTFLSKWRIAYQERYKRSPGEAIK